MTAIRVRIYHCDSYGHVNNARYLEFLEEARWQWLQPAIDTGAIDVARYSFVLVNLNINYKSPLLAGDIARISIANLSFGNASMKLEQKISNQKTGRLASVAEVTFVILDNGTGKPVPIRNEWKEILQSL